MEQQATVIVGALILAAILWLVKTTRENAETLSRLSVLLTGIDGHNGLNGDVKGLKRRLPDLERDVAILKEWKEAAQ